LSNPVFAADINLTLHQQSRDDFVSVSVENKSAHKVALETVYIELDGRKYAHPSKEIIQQFDSRSFNFKVAFPNVKGTYPLIATVRYLNDGRILSLRHVGLFHFQEQAIYGEVCSIEGAVIINEGDVRINASDAEKWRLVLPEEITVFSVSMLSGQKIYHTGSNISGFNNAYPVFSLTEETVDGTHRTGLCSGTLTVNSAASSQLRQSRVSSTVLLITALLFMSVSFLMLKITARDRPFITALVKYSSRVFFIAAAYYILKNSGSWLGYSLKIIDWKIYASFAGAVLDNLMGDNYRNFFNYFADVYFTGSFLLIFPYIYFFNNKAPLENDKYVSFLKTLCSLPGIFLRRKIFWNNSSRLGMLTIFVKLFFVPVLISWSISNILHMKNLIISPPHWDLYTLNSFLVDLFILADTSIFAFGYLVESRFLKNEIKSVDPTFFGWLVCLWCYPPFNWFSFRPFDYAFVSIAVTDCPVWVHAFVTCMITLLWGIFAWASVALCFKGSNLTNRGIVRHGPYRFVRHPAYTAKVLIWMLQGVFFAQFTAGILAAFAVIYFLRAWTEEKHLSADYDYMQYRDSVKWKFIPFVY
jgi:protein-S-isoprenylcysteine O-methyltransferase Ste14